VVLLFLREEEEEEQSDTFRKKAFVFFLLEMMFELFSDGKEHVGGNTWEGGTGGSSTAGLGGRHGPYRLDLGQFAVHQVQDFSY
jgi:hypothetical protein